MIKTLFQVNNMKSRPGSAREDHTGSQYDMKGDGRDSGASGSQRG